ncbi:hypothetical protein C0V97_01015 [Asaia sp. W19]|uniref:hypothetical protein n=1 Tax=Asaia sp. W19 TaxID=2067395 RepID=UPI000F8D9F34|nr:hypothetical protein [Asaia sp. W19]RUT27380.1 hypothetical protein C0V97_01015 [Asaia sp. W19]
MTVPAPANIEFLAQAVGDDAALCFIEQLAGQEIFIPAVAAGSRLETLYGPEIASALSSRYPKEMWRVPVCRDWRIRRYLAMGLTVNQIAARAGVTSDSVYRSLRKPYRGKMAARPEKPRYSDHRQISLF